MTAPRGGTLLAVPVAVLQTPRDGVVLTDRWWVVQGGRALFWRPRGQRGWSPQCNHDRRLPASLAEASYPDAAPEFIPVAYIGRNDDEWGYLLTPDLIAAGVAMGFEP